MLEFLAGVVCGAVLTLLVGAVLTWLWFRIQTNRDNW
jgi:hypothetical protein